MDFEQTDIADTSSFISNNAPHFDLFEK